PAYFLPLCSSSRKLAVASRVPSAERATLEKTCFADGLGDQAKPPAVRTKTSPSRLQKANDRPSFDAVKRRRPSSFAKVVTASPSVVRITRVLLEPSMAANCPDSQTKSAQGRSPSACWTGFSAAR